MALEFAKSCEDDCKVQLSLIVKALADRKFNKGICKLVGITNSVSVLPAGKMMLTSGKCVGKGDGWAAFCRSCNENPSNPTKACFFAKFWAVQSSFDQGVVNCEYQDKETEITVQGEKLKFTVPVLVNTKGIAKDEHIIVPRCRSQLLSLSHQLRSTRVHPELHQRNTEVPVASIPARQALGCSCAFLML